MDFSKDASIEQSHRFVEFYADQTTYSNTSNEAVINVDVQLGSGEYIDMDDARLVFSLAPTYTTKAKLTPYIASGWMRDFTVRTKNGIDIGNLCSNYNRYVKVAKLPLSSGDNKNVWESILEGADPANDQAASGTAVEYAHKPLVNIFTHSGYYPAFAHQGFQIRINIDDANSLSNEAGDCTAFSITDLRFECRVVKLKPEVHNSVLNQLASPEGIIFDFESTETTVANITGTETMVQFGRVAHRLKRVECVEQTSVDRAVFNRNLITGYRFRLGTDYSSPTFIKVGDNQLARHTLHYLRAHKLSPEEMNVVGDANYLPSDTNFIMAHQYDLSKVDDLISSADSKGLDLELHLTRGNGASAATAYLFKTEDRRIQILSGAMVQMLS